MTCFVGIDIAARTFAVAVRTNGKISENYELNQSPEGHCALTQALTRLAPERIVMEATGVYHFDLAVALVRAGLPACVINPRSYHHFAAMKLSPSKTDVTDAALLAEYGECMKPALWTPPDDACLALRDVARQMTRAVECRTRAKNHLHALSSRSGTDAELVEMEEDEVAYYGRKGERLLAMALRIIRGNDRLKEAFGHLCTAKGIGEITAVTVLGELSLLPLEMKGNQVSRHAGLDVRQTQSGSSVNRPGRLCKAGNGHLRRALYMGALSAAQHEPRTREFYQALQKRGKKKIQAICAIMRKYLTGLWSCIKHGQDFDATKLFSEKHRQSLDA